MVLMANRYILPAALEYQKQVAASVAAVKAAGGKSVEGKKLLDELTKLTDELKRRADKLADGARARGDGVGGEAREALPRRRHPGDGGAARSRRRARSRSCRTRRGRSRRIARCCSSSRSARRGGSGRQRGDLRRSACYPGATVDPPMLRTEAGTRHPCRTSKGEFDRQGALHAARPRAIGRHRRRTDRFHGVAAGPSHRSAGACHLHRHPRRLRSRPYPWRAIRRSHGHGRRRPSPAATGRDSPRPWRKPAPPTAHASSSTAIGRWRRAGST